jgi:methyl-accepting chemotaxis protein
LTAAKEIKGLISDSVDKVGTGTELVQQAGKTMEDILAAVNRVTGIMGDISSATHEQSSGIDQVNQTITHIDDVTQQNAALVEEVSASARSLEEQAGGLVGMIRQFKLVPSADGSTPPSTVRDIATARRSARTVAA